MLTLTRTYGRNYTRGVLDIPHITKLDTLELTFKNNEREISCIPEKHYILSNHYSEKFKECLKVFEQADINERCCLEPSLEDSFKMTHKIPKLIEVSNREGILIHSGNAVANFCFFDNNSQLVNYKCNSRGCILVGFGFSTVKDINDEEQAYITSSRKALKILYKYVKSVGGFTDLIITCNNRGNYD